MKSDRVVAWLSLGAPLLIVLAVIAAQQREGNDRVQALPAIFVGIGLIAGSTLSRSNCRKRLLRNLRSE